MYRDPRARRNASQDCWTCMVAAYHSGNASDGLPMVSGRQAALRPNVGPVDGLFVRQGSWRPGSKEGAVVESRMDAGKRRVVAVGVAAQSPAAAGGGSAGR